MVGPNGLEPSTSSVSRKRSNQTELRAYSEGWYFAIVAGQPITGNRVWPRFANFLASQRQSFRGIHQLI